MPFGKTTLLGHIVCRAKKQIPDLILNVNGEVDRVSSYGLDVIRDDMPDAGPLGGILAAMKAAKDKGYSHIITFSSDSPFFPSDYVKRLMGESGEKTAISVSGDKFHPVMGIFEVSLRGDLQDYLESGERRVMWWVRRHSHEKIIWDITNPDPFFNINRAEDLAQAEQYLTPSHP